MRVGQRSASARSSWDAAAAPSEAEATRLAALTKQLSQLDATSTKLSETLRFISDFEIDSHGTRQLLNGMHGAQQLGTLCHLDCKLRGALAELGRLTQGQEQGDGDGDGGGDRAVAHQHPASTHAAHTAKSHSAAVCGGDERSDAQPDVGGAKQQQQRQHGQLQQRWQQRDQGTSPRLVAGEAEAEVHAANDGGSVNDTELIDLETQNATIRASLSSADLRAARERNAALQAQAREVKAAEEELAALTARCARLPGLRAGQ
ncbi:hypothetical protein FOA52_009111 [Chlamydomonas sp. UWO 241]|nr:hypothetical protein FOA52_009111 [Chlamydomonas sp. UWO 241]